MSDKRPGLEDKSVVAERGIDVSLPWRTPPARQSHLMRESFGEARRELLEAFETARQAYSRSDVSRIIRALTQLETCNHAFRTVYFPAIGEGLIAADEDQQCAELLHACGLLRGDLLARVIHLGGTVPRPVALG